MQILFKRIITILLALVAIIFNANAWSEHPLLAYPVLSTIPDLKNKQPIEVMSLSNFLIKEEKGLAILLKDFEDWARLGIPNYAPSPDHLKFKATGSTKDIVRRFLYALRINPNAKMRLYLHLLPNESIGDYQLINPQELTTLNDYSSLKNTNYVEITEGQKVSPLSVLCTANDEPDYGFDLGLFENNNTNYGLLYGFGKQPFGDPNLEYGSQAPFHMGFYHEASIVYFFGPFLKKTYPEYRISLFKKLSEYAFATGNDYWGWRFMGWGMHYLGDLSMPYHTAPLPGVSPVKMIWINLKAMLGFPESKNNAVQIVSNRHAVLEYFQWVVLREAYLNNPDSNLVIKALKSPTNLIEYSYDFPRNIVAKESVERSKNVDFVITNSTPEKLVSDPKFQTPGSNELKDLLAQMNQNKGEESIVKMTELLAEIMRSYSMHLRSYYNSITTNR